MKITVSNLTNTKGNTTPNQFVKTIWDEKNNVEAIIFQSYKSDICKIDTKAQVILFGSDWDYSKTTMKHLKKFLSDYPITEGLYNLKDLRKREAEGVTKWHDNWTIFFKGRLLNDIY